VQLIQGAWLSRQAHDQWFRDLPLQAPRGQIVDATGHVLADSQTIYSVYVRPSAVRDAGAVSAVLSNALGLDFSYVNQRVTSRVSEVTIKRGVSREHMLTIRQSNLLGIYFAQDVTRRYRYGDFATQVFGFTNIDGDGQAGLEAYFNRYLRGLDGQALTGADIRGREYEGSTTYFIPPVPGASLHLHLDHNIQSFAEQAVERAIADHNAKGARAVVMDVNTGAIRALANRPSFNLNEIPRDDVALLMELSRNPIITDVYEPGSTFKIFTLAAALDLGVVTTACRFGCPGFRVIDGERIRCWRTKGHGTVDLVQGLNVSCNAVFMDLALRIGVDNFYDYIRRFGFGQKTGVDFYSESAGIIMPQKMVRTVDIARIGFGHAIAVTPLQLMAATAALVNGGNWVQPQFASHITDERGRVVERFQPVTRRVLSPQTSEQVRAMMEAVVRDGSGKNASVVGYTMGGKTGTSQKYQDGIIAQGKYVSSFIAFAPATNPRYMVLIIVDEPGNYMYYGSIVAAPYARDIFDRIFRYRQIPPDIDITNEFTQMPEVTGLTLEQAIGAIARARLQVKIYGDGGSVTKQLPPAGTRLIKGSVVLIRADTS